MSENKFVLKVKTFFTSVFKRSKNGNYISAQESKKISKENIRITNALQKKKKRKNVPESEYTTSMQDEKNVVEFDELRTYFFTDAGVAKSVDGVSFNIPQGSIVGIVGESGCGKSVTSLSLMQLVQAPQGQIVGGSIRFKMQDYKKDERGALVPIYATDIDQNGNSVVRTTQFTDKNGTRTVPVQLIDENGVPQFQKESKVFDIAKMPLSAMQKIRGKEISMIFQEPMTSLNPVFTIGYQLDEVTLLHTPGANKQSARRRSIEMLQLVGIAMPEDVCKRYTHQLSGGMRQRVMIAMSLACNPKLIIADEPTTALDVTIQAQILELLKDIKQKINGSIMLITHDLGVIAEMADYVVVMYAGRIVERGTIMEVFKNPLHPYTIGLQKSKPVVNKKVDELYSIPGHVPNPTNMPKYCYFRDRCSLKCNECKGDYPPLRQVSDTHFVACYRDLNGGIDA